MERRTLTENTERRSESRPEQRGDRRGGPRRFRRRPRVCQFCADKSMKIDYKQQDLVKRFVDDQGKIRSRRETGNCAKHQRMVAKTVKQARHMALLPFVSDRYR